MVKGWGYDSLFRFSRSVDASFGAPSSAGLAASSWSISSDADPNLNANPNADPNDDPNYINLTLSDGRCESIGACVDKSINRMSHQMPPLV